MVRMIASLSPVAVVRLGHAVGSPCKGWCLHDLPGLRERMVGGKVGCQGWEGTPQLKVFLRGWGRWDPPEAI